MLDGLFGVCRLILPRICLVRQGPFSISKLVSRSTNHLPKCRGQQTYVDTPSFSSLQYSADGNISELLLLQHLFTHGVAIRMPAVLRDIQEIALREMTPNFD